MAARAWPGGTEQPKSWARTEQLSPRPLGSSCCTARHVKHGAITLWEPALIIVSAFPLLRMVIEGEHYSVSKPRAAGRSLSGAGECCQELVAPCWQSKKALSKGLVLSLKTPQITPRLRPASGAGCKATLLRPRPRCAPDPAVPSPPRDAEGEGLGSGPGAHSAPRT